VRRPLFRCAIRGTDEYLLIGWHPYTSYHPNPFIPEYFGVRRTCTYPSILKSTGPRNSIA